MKTPRQAAIRLAILGVVAAVIVALIVQAIQRPVEGETVDYQATFGDVFGLTQNADVRLRGVQIGKVTGIELTDDARAEVGFHIQDEHRLRASDKLAIRFQNLAGQRYVEVIRGDASAPVIADGAMVTETADSFDITTVFNGLRPLLTAADPEVYNRLATNLVALIDGGSDDMTPVLKDISVLASYANDRAAVMETIVGNLEAISTEIGGRSANLSAVLKVFHSIFLPIATRMEEFISLMDKGSVELAEIARITGALSLLGLGATDIEDDLTRRIDEVIPDTTAAVRSLSLLPGLLDGLNQLIPNANPARSCSNGTFAMPIAADVLMAGRQLTVCKGDR
ncbi:mammalian cell entry protein [Gordonia sp. CNJ-863]|uniref:MlaD family protein n=1 Tax=Gordonia sp. CNJ-863 TaxID=1904963 RepID=UPI00095D259F|nr:MlaD family protein [Gordonia sp. CNJ-863]OLT45675.1 mammalian cell entry protein [Gordonia sp. CNJ-863]